jgi:ParB family chromosome partitioning protein
MGNVGSTKKRGLGRGLGALIISTEAPGSESSALASSSRVPGIQEVAIERIQPNPHQPRTHFAEETLQELAASIQVHGILQPLIVTQHSTDPESYYLIAGERRWRAARLAGLSSVPVIVREASASQWVEWALIENLQRADLNPLEEAHAYQTLIDEFALTQEEVATRVGKSRSAVANTVRLLKLPLALQEALTQQRISAGHAKVLVSLEKATLIEQAFAVVVAQELTVRQTEALVRQLLTAPAASSAQATQSPAPVQTQLSYLEGRFRQALGTRVNLSRNGNGSGRLVIHFYNDDDLEQLYRRIAGEDESEG